MEKHVCTITPNPALDLGGVVDRIKPDEKTYVHDETRFPGGNAINVARILRRLDVSALATGFLGGGTGAEIDFLLKREGVKTKFVKIAGYSRISVTVSNRSDHRQTRLSFPGPSVSKREKDRLFDLFEKRRGASVLVVGGSLPEGFGAGDLKRLISSAKDRKIEAVIDCPGGLLREIISAGPLLIKPNLDEFQELTRSGAETLSAVYRRARRLLNHVPFVCVSSVEGGTLLVTSEGCYFGRIPKVKIRSTVGAGDSMVASMTAQIFRGNRSAQELLRWGLAASAATLSHTGTALGTASEIRRLYASTRVEAVGSRW